jgi:hypothetical protein
MKATPIDSGYILINSEESSLLNSTTYYLYRISVLYITLFFQVILNLLVSYRKPVLNNFLNEIILI